MENIKSQCILDSIVSYQKDFNTNSIVRYFKQVHSYKSQNLETEKYFEFNQDIKDWEPSSTFLYQYNFDNKIVEQYYLNSKNDTLSKTEYIKNINGLDSIKISYEYQSNIRQNKRYLILHKYNNSNLIIEKININETNVLDSFSNFSRYTWTYENNNPIIKTQYQWDNHLNIWYDIQKNKYLYLNGLIIADSTYFKLPNNLYELSKVLKYQYNNLGKVTIEDEFTGFNYLRYKRKKIYNSNGCIEVDSIYDHINSNYVYLVALNKYYYSNKTSVSEKEINSKIIVYPIPSYQYLTIENATNNSFEFYDMSTNQILLKGTIDSEQFNLDILEINSGVHFIRLVCQEAVILKYIFHLHFQK